MSLKVVKFDTKMYLNFSNFRGRTSAGGWQALVPKWGQVLDRGDWQNFRWMGTPSSPQEKTLQDGAHLKKGLFFTYFSHFLVTKEKIQKFLQHISHSHNILLTLLTFLALPILKKKNEFIRYGFWVLVLICIRAMLEQSIKIKMVSKI